ncbi:MAG: hypothetical protein AAFU85_13365 [Planctomycetota bacterium]
MVIRTQIYPDRILRHALVLGSVLSCPVLATTALGQEYVAPSQVHASPVKRMRRLPPVTTPTLPKDAVETQRDSAPFAVAETESSTLRHQSRTRWNDQSAKPVLMPSNARSTPWLQSITSDSCSSRARALIEEASREYSVRAWASAEASSWEALEHLARGIDIADQRTSSTLTGDQSTVQELAQARTALREARDFVVFSVSMDRRRIETVVASHQTPVFSNGVPAGINAVLAADRYLDFARRKLTGMARASVDAARALDLIAAVRLGRDEANQLPMETSLCLRRAAFRGQPSNGSLASRLGIQLSEMGLDVEAERTLKHALSIEPSQQASAALATVMSRSGEREEATQLIAEMRQAMPKDLPTKRVPQVLELTPEQFAAISPAHNLTFRQPAISPESAARVGTANSGSSAAGRGRLEASPVGFPSRTKSHANATPPPQRPSDEYSEEAYRADRDPSYYKATRPPSTMQRILGKLPRLPKFKVW